MSKLSTFFEELKARKVRKTLGIYLASALTTLTIVRYFAEAYELPKSVLTIALTILTCGIASAFLFAWYHGKEGSQKFTRNEMGLHLVVAIIAITTSLRLATGPAKLQLPERFGKSVAVMPFVNTSGKPEDEYFTNGVTEDILTQLAQINDLRVLSYATTLRLKGTTKSPGEIGKELGVSAVLTGSVRRDGERIRITGQLLSSSSDEFLWAETYDREFRNIFAIQSDVARKIADELRARVTDAENRRVGAEPTTNAHAYELYLRARDFKGRGTSAGNEIAIDMLRKAIGLDPRFARAHAELGLAFRQRYITYGFPAAWADSALEQGMKAVELDPTGAEGYRTLGSGYEALGKNSLALQSYRKAIELNPNYAAAIGGVGWGEYYIGRLDEALAWLRKSVDLAPDAGGQYIDVGLVLNMLGEDSLALKWFRRAIEVQEDVLPIAYYHLTYSHLFNRNIEGARKFAREALNRLPDDLWTLHSLGDTELMDGKYEAAKEYYSRAVTISSNREGPEGQLAYTLLKLGETDQAKRLMDSSVALFTRLSSESPEDSHNPYVVASIYASQGKHSQAISWLKTAMDRGYSEFRWLNVDPLFDPIRKVPEFKLVVADLRNRVETMRSSARMRGLLSEYEQ